MPIVEEGRSPATLVCPACQASFANPRVLAVHEERHRPVEPPAIDSATGREISHPCSAGCGRNFRTLALFREHAPICDGMPPLAPFNQEKGMPETGDGRPLACPECLEEFGTDHEKLAVHIERHREVGKKILHKRTGEAETRECPKGCGRHFLSKKEYKEHTTLCDGSPPLPPGKPKPPPAAPPIVIIDSIDKLKGKGMLKCEDCNEEFQKPNTLAIHRRFKHGVPGKSRRGPGRPRGSASKPRDGDAAAPAAPAGAELARDASDGAGLLFQLKKAAQDHRDKASRIEELAKELETLL